WGALAMTALQLIPTATFKHLPLGVTVDLAGRALAFFSLAFALQWFFGARLGPHDGAVAWPPSLATTLPFLIVPVVMRLRQNARPAFQQRLLATVIVSICIVATLLTNSGGWQMDVAMTLGVAYLGYTGWRLGVYHQWATSTLPRRPMIGVFAACAVSVASAPIKFALGFDWLHPYWPGDNLIAWIAGVFVGLTAGQGEPTSAPTSQNSRMA
ncbi:MAG: hypothetical protein ACKOEC_01550, partial [Acidimicrobiia bacterium]